MNHRTHHDDRNRTRDALNAFTEDFLTTIDKEAEGNTISSPLGAWLLLSQLAGANTFPYSHTELLRYKEALHLPVKEACNVSTNLLANIPSAVSAAIAGWGRTSSLNTDFLEGLTENNVPFHDRVPTKEELDRWAAENTKDIINEFPIIPTADLVLLLATAVATKVEWREPFEEVTTPAGSRWDRKSLLHSPDDIHHKFFTYDEEGNLYFGLTARADGLNVTTIVPDNPDLDKATVQAHANLVATGAHPNHLLIPTSTLPESASGLYTVTRAEGYNDEVSATVPAWDAESNHDLSKLTFPWEMLVGALTPEGVEGGLERDYDMEARQVAKASYRREGFEAAAVSAFMLTRAAMPRRRQIAIVDVTVDRPHAVVAVVTERNSPWNWLPVFNAWVEN